MPASNLPAIAVIADAHFHDLFGDYDFAGIPAPAGRMALRPLADTGRSTRVFNESHAALKHALDGIAARGIRHVVLLGDYSDDGQRATIAGLRRVLADYAGRYGMDFYATTGNHDIFGPAGRHRTKRFSNGDGRFTLVTSNPAMDDPRAAARIVSDTMFCSGYPAGLQAMADMGFFRKPGYLHWETPFGDEDDDPSARLYQVVSPDGSTRRTLMDGSYLVEPFDGVWLLMIDANVFEPIAGALPETDSAAFADSSDAGWNAMLRHKRFVLDWMRDVGARAAASGKRLLAFSHYPVIDPLNGTLADEFSVLGRTSLSGRIPSPTVARAVAAAGIRLHFSGHLHVNDTARFVAGSNAVVNVAVPSLVAFPAAYKIVTFGDGEVEISTVAIADMPLDANVMAEYRREAAVNGSACGAMLDAEDYGAFLSAHIGHLVGRRFLRREWPRDLAQLVHSLTLADVAVLALAGEVVRVEEATAMLPLLHARAGMATALPAFCWRHGLSAAGLEQIPLIDFVGDWYRLRMGSDLALDDIADDRMRAYDALVALYAACGDRTGLNGSFQRLLRMFGRFRTGLPSRNFTVNLGSGAVTIKT